METRKSIEYLYTVCTDCLFYVAYGDLPPDSTEKDDKAIIDGAARLSLNGDLYAVGTDLGFSYEPCDCCRRPLGGDRHRAIALHQN